MPTTKGMGLGVTFQSFFLLGIVLYRSHIFQLPPHEWAWTVGGEMGAVHKLLKNMDYIHGLYAASSEIVVAHNLL